VAFTSLTFNDVTRNFGRRRALHRVSFSCQAGQIVALLGANGAGKSTLLSIAATLLEPSSGMVLYGERTARQAGDGLRASIGVLGHDLYIYPELTAAENLTFFARLYGVRDVPSAVAAALAHAALEDRAHDPVGSFSRGMRQRLALERALLHGPRLLLLDEPFTGLDRQGSKWLSEFLQGFKASGGAIVLATHSFGSALGAADRVAILAGGRLFLARPAADLSADELRRIYDALTDPEAVRS
jgi:heme exporter protein A